MRGGDPSNAGEDSSGGVTAEMEEGPQATARTGYLTHEVQRGQLGTSSSSGMGGQVDGGARTQIERVWGEIPNIRLEHVEAQAPVSYPNRAVRGRLNPKVCSKLVRHLAVNNEAMRPELAQGKGIRSVEREYADQPSHTSWSGRGGERDRKRRIGNIGTSKQPNFIKQTEGNVHHK